MLCTIQSFMSFAIVKAENGPCVTLVNFNFVE